MDYIVQEFAKLDREKYFLIILGQFEEETVDVTSLASSLLQKDDYIFNNVALDKVSVYYKAADYFVLASLWEGFGRVLLEAASFGLPVLVHDYVIAREVLGEMGIYLDMNQPGALAHKINSIDLAERQQQRSYQQIEYIRSRYSWEVVDTRYHELIAGMINMPVT